MLPSSLDWGVYFSKEKGRTVCPQWGAWPKGQKGREFCASILTLLLPLPSPHHTQLRAFIAPTAPTSQHSWWKLPSYITELASLVFSFFYLAFPSKSYRLGPIIPFTTGLDNTTQWRGQESSQGWAVATTPPRNRRGGNSLDLFGSICCFQWL